MEGDDDDFLYRPRRAKGQRLDPAIKRMAMAAGGVSIVVIVIAWLWSGFHPYTFGPPPVISPPTTPLRIVPEDPGGLEVPEADVPIMSGQSISDIQPQLAPAGAVPDITALDQEAGLTPASALQPPMAQANADDEANPDKPKSLKPAMSQTPRPGSTATSAAAAEGLSSVELAAMGSEDAVLGFWVTLQQKFPQLMTGRQPEIFPSIANGQSVWRLRLGGFTSSAAAQTFCNTVAAQGTACSVVTY